MNRCLVLAYLALQLRHIIFKIVLFLAISLTLSMAVVTTAQEQVKNKVEGEMTDDEKILSWKGEKVIILKDGLEFIDFIYIGCKAKDKLPRDEYAGKTGVIIESIPESRSPDRKMAITIALDGTNEKIVFCYPSHLGFFAELEYAKSLIGQEVWAKGKLKLSDDCSSFTKWDRGKIEVAITTKLVVTRAEWGHANRKIVLFFKTEANQEGCLADRGYFLDKYTLKELYGNLSPHYMSQFYLQDPHKQFPSWSLNIWKLIEKGEVAIGMTEDMARLACGGEMKATGFILSSSGEETSTIYECGNKKFLVEKGKVTKYID